MEPVINFRQIVKDEVDKYLKELGFPVKEEKVGFKDDEIFLLSIEEYEKYKDVILKINCWWWLRSRGRSPIHGSDSTAGVLGYQVDLYGYSVSSDDCGVRPALKFLAAYNEDGIAKIGDRIMVYNFPWILIDKNLAIAEVPIAFDKFDDKSNDYENSYVRKYLKEWVDKRR